MKPQLHPTSVADGHVPVPARPPHRYVYDGMRVIQTRQGNNTPYVSYTRGTDLNGSLEGAGGIGGLLARSHLYSGGNWYLHNFYHADGNGNVTYLVNSSQGLAASYYRYDPYGNLISQSGSLASANVYRFSSKESLTHNPQSGAAMEYYYYGYRWYAPNVQRWPNRDPLADRGWNLLAIQITAGVGPNLYRFIGNDPMTAVDPFGLQMWMCTRKAFGGKYGVGRHAYFWDDSSGYNDQPGHPDQNRSCGQESSSGKPKLPSTDVGPLPGFEGDRWSNGDAVCYPIKNMDPDKEKKLKDCCHDPKRINAGVWFPFINDCHNGAVSCAEQAGIPPEDLPPHPRGPGANY